MPNSVSSSDEEAKPSPTVPPKTHAGSPDQALPTPAAQSLSTAVTTNVRSWFHALSNAVEQWGFLGPAGPFSNELWILGHKYYRENPDTSPQGKSPPSAPEGVYESSPRLSASPPAAPPATPHTPGDSSPLPDPKPPLQRAMALGTSTPKEIPYASSLIGSITNPLAGLSGASASYPAAFLHDFESRIWCTYRSQFPALPNSTLTTDAGWGCMLRSAQSLVAQAYVVYLLGRDWRTTDEDQSVYRTYRQKGAEFDNAVGNWFGPHMACHVLRDLINRTRPMGLQAYLATDGVVYQDTLVAQSKCSGEEEDGDTPSIHPTLILVPTRLGIQNINKIYYAFLKYCFTLSHFVGIAGGKPGSAAYFVGFEDNGFIFLDPHFTRTSPQLDPADQLPSTLDTPSFHCSTPFKISLDRLDPCMMLGFFVRNIAEFEDLREQLTEFTNRGLGTPVFEIADRAPDYLYGDDASDSGGDPYDDDSMADELESDRSREQVLDEEGSDEDDDSAYEHIISRRSIASVSVPDSHCHTGSLGSTYLGNNSPLDTLVPGDGDSSIEVISAAATMAPQPIAEISRPLPTTRHRWAEGEEPTSSVLDDMVEVTEAQATERPVRVERREVEDDEAEARNHGIISQSESEPEDVVVAGTPLKSEPEFLVVRKQMVGQPGLRESQRPK